jgi:hypothetical protein
MPDVNVENHGTLFLFRLNTETAQSWAVENVPGATYFAGAVVCEARYARDLAQGMIDDGLMVE